MESTNDARKCHSLIFEQVEIEITVEALKEVKFMDSLEKDNIRKNFHLYEIDRKSFGGRCYDLNGEEDSDDIRCAPGQDPPFISWNSDTIGTVTLFPRLTVTIIADIDFTK